MQERLQLLSLLQQLHTWVEVVAPALSALLAAPAFKRE
jgi:hypothetical protein